MKNTLQFMLSVFLLAICMTSCSKSDVEDESLRPPVARKNQLSVELILPSVTMDNTDSVLQMTWGEQDSLSLIAMFSSSSLNKILNISSGADTNKGVFTGDTIPNLSKAQSIYAVIPPDSKTTGSDLVVDLSNQIVSKSGIINHNNAYLYGSTIYAKEDLSSITLKHLCGFIKTDFTLPKEGRIKQIELSSENDLYSSRSFSMDEESYNDSNNVKGTITATLSDAIITDSMSTMIAMLPGDYTGLIYTVTYTDGSKYRYTSSSDSKVKIELGHSTLLKISANQWEEAIDTTIDPNDYVQYLKVEWTPINTDGVPAYDPVTMQGITKNRNEIDLTDSIPHIVYNLVEDYGAVANDGTDQSAAMQRALDDISGYAEDSDKKGGILVIPDGDYHVNEIIMRSHVMVVCHKGVVFEPTLEGREGRKFTMFSFGSKKDDSISCSGMRGTSDGRFNVSLPEWEKGITVWSVNKVSHYIFSNITINDNKTVYCCFGLGCGDLKDHTDQRCSVDGYIGYVDSHNCHFGYGLMQLQSARKLHVEHIYSSGGVCLRMETGWNLMNQYSTQGEGGIFDITGYDITGENGAEAVMVNPHSQQEEGTFCVENITSNSCCYGIYVEDGFVAKVKDEDGNKTYIKGVDDDGNFTLTLTKGKFDKSSFMRDVHVTFGTNAQVRVYPEYLIYMPDEYIGEDQLRDSDGSFRECAEPVASLSPIFFTREKDDSGDYTIDWSKTKVSYSGFKYNTGDDLEDLCPVELRDVKDAMKMPWAL